MGLSRIDVYESVDSRFMEQKQGDDAIELEGDSASRFGQKCATVGKRDAEDDVDPRLHARRHLGWTQHFILCVGAQREVTSVLQWVEIW